MSASDAIRAELARVAVTLGAPETTVPEIERPRDPSFGDWASNVALMLARPLGRKPREVAEQLVAGMELARIGVKAAEIAGPGFINFRLDPAFAANGLRAILDAGERYGRAATRHEQPVVVEFVSANPTGPLHVGHGRQAALGDAISTLLDWTGSNVTREYYYNDAGVQIANLGLSVQARVRELAGQSAEMPAGGYHGEYVREIAARYVGERPDDAAGDDLDAITATAVRELRREQDLDLRAFGVAFDSYFLESSLYTDGKVESTVAALVASGHAYEHEDALWLRTTAFGDDKDRVMRKRDGSYTYFVPDVAYHVTKWERGFRAAINVQGADHHGTTARVRAGLQALGVGIPQGYPAYVLHQMVTVMRGGEEVKISKRAGSYVTVRDLIDEVGRDAVRYFFLMRKGDSQLVFDVDLARTQSEENPVYYIQMAHARMCGIFRVGELDREAMSADGVALDALTEPAELDLINALADFPRVVAGAAESLEPHRVATYLLETARAAHLWYAKHHVLGEPEPVLSARLVLARAAQIVIRNGLQMLGITAPERM
jgi:arginyl-tRNA synthetase